MTRRREELEAHHGAARPIGRMARLSALKRNLPRDSPFLFSGEEKLFLEVLSQHLHEPRHRGDAERRPVAMGGQNGRTCTPVKPGPETSLKRDLLNEGHAFSFFQVMRLLSRLGRGSAEEEGANAAPDREPRIRPRLSLGFPPADVDRVEERVDEEGARFVLTTTFLGLYGASSPLPTFYTEDLMDEASKDESVSREFWDVVNQRFYQLLFQCWLKYRQFFQVAENGGEDDLERLYSLLGLGEERHRADMPAPTTLFRYIGLFTQRPRSALGLKTLLSDALGAAPLDVTPCVERRAKIPDGGSAG